MADHLSGPQRTLNAIRDLVVAAEGQGWDQFPDLAPVLGRGREAYQALRLILDDELPEYDQMAPCPYCGGATETSHGIAGGCPVIYTHCDDCGRITSQSPDPETA